jgi:hypothetical protein
VAIAAYKKPAQARPALALSIAGEIYDLKAAQDAGLKVGGIQLIATGTPTGVGMTRGIFLKAGDVVGASIVDIGTLSNSVLAEKL